MGRIFLPTDFRKIQKGEDKDMKTDKKIVFPHGKTQKSLYGSRNISGWIFMLPMIVILYLFIWRPTILSSIWSFFNMRGYSVEEFCGWDNYRKVVTHTKFLPMLWVNFKFVFWSLVIGFLPPYIIAVMLNEIVHFKNTLRILTYIPAVIPGIAAMLIWKFMYSPDTSGLLNVVLAKFGIAPYGWLNDPKFVIIGISIYNTWKGLPGAVLLYYAALQGVSPEIYEAAQIDGAGPWRKLWHVTRPATEGILLLCLVRQIIGAFQIMEQPLAMTGGGPNGASTSLSYQLYQYGFNSGGQATGQAMALGVIIFLILIVFTVFYFVLNKIVENRY